MTERIFLDQQCKTPTVCRIQLIEVADQSKTVVYAAIAAGIAVATTKFIAGAITGSSAMFAEAIHYSVDVLKGAHERGH